WALRSGLRLGVASSNNRYWVESFLVQHSIRTHFSVIRTIEDVAVGKPAPDLYWSAVQGLGVRPQHCLAVEDSANGVRAALAAGIGCVVAVPNKLTAHLPFPDRVDARVESLTDLDPVAAFVRARRSAAR